MTEALRERLKQLPDSPGCYLMRDRRGRIIYVGKAISLRRRVQSYFRPATIRKAEPRLRSLLKSVNDVEWIVTRNEDQALSTEDQLIKEHQPRYNVLLRDDKRYLAIRCDLRAPLPRFTTCRLLRDDGATYFGPFPAGGRFVRPVIDYLERKFGLRRCTPHLPDAETYRHCNDDIIRTCTAPCVGRIDQQSYRQRVNAACAVLRGESPALLTGLAGEMERAVKQLDFERAAWLRDIRSGLIEMARQRARGPVVTAAQHRATAQKGVRQLQEVLRLPAPPNHIETVDISNTSGVLAVASLVVAIDGMPDRRRYRLFHIRDVAGPDDPRMIAEAVERRFSRILREELPLPDLLLVDGGITQLRAARRVLAKLSLSEIKVVALAERFEELVVDDGRAPLRLERDSPALKLVMHLRDEAHRFAITHHRRLRNRRIRESALDEIPGIGPKRKLQLLQTFGSVARIARLSQAELMAQPHIGPQLAQAILQRLAQRDTTGENP